ncbi:MAG: family 1 glycosylhydrolase [Nitrospiraceae bacterium]|nr:family 1 glycosylhydrolase [Nitrospiraceae bacterium]
MSGKFLWGVATSAFQLDGSPSADWTSWDPALGEKPGLTGHREVYRQDLRLLKELGVNAYRFSIEWSRIEPEEGRWDEGALAFYGELVEILRSYQIEPMLTLNHFTHPLWFAEKYPWHHEGSTEKFLRFAGKVLSVIKGVRYWITFNEPYVLVLGGYFEGCMPPGLRDPSRGFRALTNILVCHSGLYRMIHDRVPGAMVSLAHNMAAIAPWHPWNPLDRLLSRLGTRFYNRSLIEVFMTGILSMKLPFSKELKTEVPVKGKLDFLGVNYYTRTHLRFNPLKNFFVELRHKDVHGYGLTDLGWEVHPDGLHKVLKYASRLGVPIIITENGIATKDDEKKKQFIKMHMDALRGCIDGGIGVRGYFYWSFMDNYEWLQGFDSRFGLYRVDFDTMERKPTSAVEFYAALIRKSSSF